MEKTLLKKIVILLLLLPAACAVPPSQDSLSVVREKAVTLPGAVVSADGSQISYPGNILFSEGAVLPLPGGMDILDPLVELFQASPGLTIIGTVRSGGHDQEYDRLLADKRLDILMKIFRNRGIAEQRLQLTAEAGAGAPLELRFQPSSTATSSGEKT